MQPFLSPPGQRIRALFRLLMAGALLSGLLWIGSPATVRAEGGDYGDGLNCAADQPKAYVSGSGQITNGFRALSAGGKVSYQFNSNSAIATGIVGDWSVQFTNVTSSPSLNGAVFNATSFTNLKFCTDEGSTAFNAATFTAEGTLNGVSGYSIQVQIIDRGEPGTNDSLQLRLSQGPTVLYASKAADFPIPQNKLSSGNYQIHESAKTSKP